MAPTPPSTNPASQAIRVLVVDDDPSTVELMVNLLEDEGFATLEAHNGEDALEIVRRERPELVLLDVVLPDLNGRDVCTRIKKDPELHEVFIILVSGHEITREKRILGLESGADEYLSKPVQIAELVARIRSFIRIHEAREALRRANESLERRVHERTRELSEANDCLRNEIEEHRKTGEKLQLYAGELRRLSRRLIETQELERRRIARELHDEAGQAMTVLKFVFNELEDMLPETGRERLDDGQHFLNRLIALIRNLYQEVRPSILDDLGLLPALLWQFDRYTLSTRVNVRFKHEGIESRRFSPDLETAAYRVTQESLTNVARHAAVDSVCVQIRADRQNLQVRIRDEGSGFDSERKRYKSDGCGMLGMSERVQLLGGRFHVASRPCDGTSIEADFPLQLPDVPVFPTTNSGQK